MKSTVVFAISRLLDTVLYFRRCEASNVLPGLNLETYKCAKTHYVVHVRMTADDKCLMHEEYKKASTSFIYHIIVHILHE